MGFSISVDIAAPPERVWAVMSDVVRWPEWTASIRSVRLLNGDGLLIGSRALIRQPRLPPAMWTVTEFEPNRGFAWVSTAPGLRVTGRHTVVPAGAGSRATLSLGFEGPLSPILVALTRRLNDRYLAMEAAGLKARSEGGT